MTVAEIPIGKCYIDQDGNVQLRIGQLDTAQPQPGDTLTCVVNLEDGSVKLSHDHLSNTAVPVDFGITLLPL